MRTNFRPVLDGSESSPSDCRRFAQVNCLWYNWMVDWVGIRAKTESASTAAIWATLVQRFYGYFVDSAAPNDCSCILDGHVRIFAATPPITSPTLPSASLQHIITSLPIIPCCSASLWLLRRLLNLLYDLPRCVVALTKISFSQNTTIYSTM